VRIRLDIAYDGTGFRGWARQPGLRTVQGTLEDALARVVGRHCESGDVVVDAEYLPADVAPGDLLAVAATSAYCFSLASNYNYTPRPPVVAVRDGAARVIVRGESIDDLLSRDVGVPASTLIDTPHGDTE